MQRLPDHRRPARYFAVEGGTLSRGLVFDDAADLPRRRIILVDFPDVPDWWGDALAVAAHVASLRGIRIGPSALAHNP